MTRIEKIETAEGLEWPTREEVANAAKKQTAKGKKGFSPAELAACLLLSSVAVIGLPQLYVQHPDNLVAERLKPHTWSDEIETFAQTELNRDRIVTRWQYSVDTIRELYVRQRSGREIGPLDRDLITNPGEDLYTSEPKLNLSIAR